MAFKESATGTRPARMAAVSLHRLPGERPNRTRTTVVPGDCHSASFCARGSFTFRLTARRPEAKTLFRGDPGCLSPSSAVRVGRSALGALQAGDMMVHCAGCERPILDRFLLNVLDRAWHAKCVQCCECNCNLTEKCFSRDGKLYCKTDFFRFTYHPPLFPPLCSYSLTACSHCLLEQTGGLICIVACVCSNRAQLINQAVNQSISRSVGQSVNQSVSQSVNQSAGKAVRQSIPLSVIPAPDCRLVARSQNGGSVSSSSLPCNGLHLAAIVFRSDSRKTTQFHFKRDVGEVWFQNRRSKERRMKQLSALGARRHAFFRGPRRMRPLGGRLEDADILGPGAYGYYGEYQGDYYGPGSNYDFFPHGPPSSQAQSPAESPYILGSGPGAMEGPGHHPSDDQRFTDMISHAETPSPEPGLPGSLQPVPGEAYGGGPSPPFSLASNSSYSAPMSHQGPEMGETTAW
ncbi:putative LIM/homeobox protein Lhx5 [Scophthalmus maximus]|uniref:Putative LIM/homeobox protein Lhx5 n=1 Tax=Scophthalmus maximus TaxID=52904 RepID=A0A2U9B9N1_SCOMX|nr:putative LIM/homeobox protein Lhx5 [Scophthalmus maximus]